MPDSPPPPPRRRARRWPWLVLAGVSVAFVLQSELMARLLARVAGRALSPLLGEDVTIAAIDVDLWPLAVDVAGAVVTHPATGDTVLAVPRARATVAFDGLRPHLGRVDLTRPLVELHLDPDGLREFRALAGRGGGGDTDELPWDELHIREGSFVLHGQGWDLGVEGVGLAPALTRARSDLTIDTVRLRLGALDQSARNLVFPEIGFGPDWVEVPNLAVEFPAMRVEGRVAARIGGALEGDLAVLLRLARLTAPTSPPPPRWVDGTVDVDVRLSGQLDHPLATGRLAVAGLTFWGPGSKGPAPVRIGDLDSAWRAELGGERPTVHLEGGVMRWDEATLTVDASVGLVDPTVKAKVHGTDVHLASILASVGAAPTPWVDFAATVDAEAEGTWSPLALAGPAVIDLVGLRVGDAPVRGPHEALLTVPRGRIAGRWETDGRKLVIDGRDVRAGRSHGRAWADIGFSPAGPLRVDIDFPVLDLSWLAPLGDLGLAGLARVKGRIGGPYTDLRADATLAGEGVVVLGFPLADRLQAQVASDMKRLWFTDVRAELGRTAWTGSYAIDFERDMAMDTAIAVGHGRLADLLGVFVDLDGIDGDVTGTLALVGTPYDLDGDASFELGDTEIYGERFAGGHAFAHMDDGELTIEEMVLERGPETLRARGSVKRGYRMNVEVRSEGLDLARLDHLDDLPVPVEGELVLDAVIGGTLYDWEPRGRIALRRAAYGGEALADSTVTFSTAEGVIAWRGSLLGDAARLGGTVGIDGAQPYRVDGTLDDLPLHVLWPRAVDGSPVSATVSGALALAGAFGDEAAPADLDLTLETVDARWGSHHLVNEGPWVLSVDGPVVTIPEAKLVGDDGSRFTFAARTEPGLGLLWEGRGHLDLDLMRAVVPGLEVARGRLDLVATRAAEDPTARVRAEVVGATVRTAYFPETFSDLDVAVDAAASGYTLQNLSASVGGGRIEAPLSSIQAEGWLPRRYALQASVRDARVRYFDYLPPFVGDADLAFDGPVDDLLLSGNLVITEMDFRDRIDWEAEVLSLREERLTGAAPEAGERWFGMDLAVRADGTVRLDNNVADAQASASLRIIGDTARPGMVGEIRVTPGGRMYLQEREFEITRGELRFVDPYTFDPDLDILLETDIRSRDEDYHVRYAVSGPFSDWRTTTTSDPSLAQADVNALLLFGYTREELERYGGLSAALVAETSDLLLGQTALARSSFLVDRWSLVSGVSERGSTTTTSGLRLVATKQVGDFDFTVETTVSDGVGRDWYASVERRLAQRLYATLYLATEQEGRTLPIGAAYGAEFKLRWEWD